MSEDRPRLQRFLSSAGIASRRAAEDLIRAGRVRVNGELPELGSRVNPRRDVVEVDGRRVDVVEPVWLAVNKPIGYLSTRSDPGGRSTVYDLVPKEYQGLFHVGRLDLLSEGLILLTNDGATAHRLLHPSFEVERVYRVRVRGSADEETRQALLRGVELEDGVARARAVEMREAKGGVTELRITLVEGRKREVRRMLSALGLPVARLMRQSYGPVRLGHMKPGAWRRLNKAEVARLRATRQGGGGHGRSR
jgi:23S rRNA pseudouridine2605 synthase